MTKPLTVWIDKSGTSTASPINEGFSLLLETGFNLLLESNGDLLLEATVITTKNSTQWTAPTKQRTSWNAPDGYSTPTVAEYTRTTQQGDTRITQQGDTRTTEGVEYSPKHPTIWSTL